MSGVITTLFGALFSVGQRRPQAGPFSDGLWGIVERVLSFGSDPSPRHALNRLAKQSAGKRGIDVPWLSEANCSLSREEWPLDRLIREVPPKNGHQRYKPKDATVPVIVLKVGARFLLIDGRTRINKWTRENDDGPHSVIVIRLREASDEAPAR